MIPPLETVMKRFSIMTFGVIAVGTVTTACNTFTGVGDLDVAPGAVGPAADPLVLADGVELTGLAMYQALKTQLMEDGAVVDSDIPMVANRKGLLRVFYERTDGTNDPKSVTVRVHLESTDWMPPADDPEAEQEPIEITTPIGPQSAEGTLGSTINVVIPAERMLPNTEFRVEILQDREEASGDNDAAAFPAPDDTPARLRVQTVGPLHLRLVPIQYNADGSGRLPDISEAQLARYKTAFEEMYPIPEVIITVDEPWPTDIPAQTSGGFSQLLDALREYRQSANAQPYEYFYGIFDPDGTDGIAGLASLGGSPDSRVGVGLGTTGGGSVNTAIHEVGHEHGRPHSPGCGADGADDEWPRVEEEATLGTWGYSPSSGALYDPTGERRDFMSYCGPEWVSDYVWQQLFAQSQFTNPANLGMAKRLLPPQNKRYARLKIHPDGSTSWLSDLTLRYEAEGIEDVEVDVTIDGQTVARSGTFYGYDHADGGVLYIPVQLDSTIADATFSIHGLTLQAVR